MHFEHIFHNEHNRIFKTQKANISVSVYRPQGTDVSQICYYYCPLKMPTRGNQVVCVTFIVVIKVPRNPDLQLSCDMLHNRFVQTLYIQAFCCAHGGCVVVCNFVLSLLLKFGSLKSGKNVPYAVENSRTSVYLCIIRFCRRSVFWRWKATLDLFSWNDRAGLVSRQRPFSVHAIHAARSSSIRPLYRRNMGSQGVVLGMSATGKQGERMTKGL